MNFRDYANENYESVLEGIRDLCAIPAPSHFEDERAEYCKRFLEENGAEGVYIDEAKNKCPKCNRTMISVVETKETK